MVINGYAREKGISTKTIQQVKEYIKQRGYVPYRPALILKTRKHLRVGILYCDRLYSHLIEAFNKITDLFSQQPDSLETLIVKRQFLIKGVQELLARGVNNLIWIHTLQWQNEFTQPELLNYLANFDKVLIYNYHFGPGDNSAELIKRKFYLIGVERLAGYQKIARFFKKLGHQKIALIVDMKMNRGVAQKWLQIYQQQGLKPYQLEIPPRGQLKERAQIAATKIQACLKKEKITGVNFLDDEYAAYTMMILRRMGIRIPQQLSIISYDGMPFTEFVTPALTTLAVPVKAMTQTIANIIQGKIEKEYYFSFPLKIIKRETHQILNSQKES